MIPILSGRVLGGVSPALFGVRKPASAYAEALRSSFTALTLGSLDRPPKVIQVTSSLPDEGKSTYPASLAGLLAKSNPEKRIVLVDCDLRRSAVVKSLGQPESDATLDRYLTGACTLEDAVRRDEESGLYFIGARVNTPNSAEILDSNAMRSFVATLSATYDVIVLDTPPVMAVSDARVVSRIADYIVFLVRWERTPRELVINALSTLRDLRKPIGVVLSQVDVRRHSKYGYGDYGYYYSKYRDYYRN